MDQLEYQTIIKQSEQMLKQIVDNYVRPDSSREVNLPVAARKPFLREYEAGHRHFDLITECAEHITNMLKVNNLAKFLKAANLAEPLLSPAKTTGIASPTVLARYKIKDIAMNQSTPPYSAQGKKSLMRLFEVSSERSERSQPSIFIGCCRLSQTCITVLSDLATPSGNSH